MTSVSADRVSVRAGWLWLFWLGTPLVGFGLGFAVDPFVEWVTSFLPDVPGPLKLAARIPRPWLVPILTVIGIGVGIWLAEETKRDTLTLTVDADSIVTDQGGAERYIQRSQVASVFTDPGDLVVLDADGREVFRGSASDVSTRTLAATLRRHGYPWAGTRDPHEDEYRRWIDGHPDLDEDTNALLRARRRALDAKEKAEAEELRTRLQERGVVVRDREKAQQYRRLAGSA